MKTPSKKIFGCGNVSVAEREAWQSTLLFGLGWALEPADEILHTCISAGAPRKVQKVSSLAPQRHVKGGRCGCCKNVHMANGKRLPNELRCEQRAQNCAHRVACSLLGGSSMRVRACEDLPSL